MTKEEIKTLGEKIVNGSASPEEKLRLLRELNTTIENMRGDIASLKGVKKASEDLAS